MSGSRILRKQMWLSNILNISYSTSRRKCFKAGKAIDRVWIKMGNENARRSDQKAED